MRLFIIGNGFDLAHKLPTKYWHFREYLENLHPDFLRSFEQHYYIYPNDSDEYKKNLLWNDFETNLANINEDVIIENVLAVEMGLESGDVGIEETLRIYFKKEYQYIEKLADYLKHWVRTVKVRDTLPTTTLIDAKNNDFFINFNYTSVLETVYQINPSNILHIHGSLHDYNDDPVLGHGNLKRIENIKAKRNEAQTWCNEKEVSICNVIRDYYITTFKNINNYMHKLSTLYKYRPEEIIVIGHSVDGIDLPYFRTIDNHTNRNAIWKIYYFNKTEKDKMKQALENQGIVTKRIKMLHCSEFYNLKVTDK